MTPELETERLFLKPLALADAEQIQRLFPRWEIVRYLNRAIPWPYPADGARTFIERVLQEMERGESYFWTLRPKTAVQQLIGVISLFLKKEESRGFWVNPEWQGKGMMTEASDEVTNYWFDVLKQPVLRAPKALVNEASRRISVKQGMRIVAREDRDYVIGRLPSEIWEITAEEWHARQRISD
ncbi:MAG TPA: GNAT family N-acetyltransferase, partial [Candidatus Acidoferrum sp.]|nr:GNAT family N-acetyltransferase [Candidatus Acidoferrum sp.]